MEDEIGDLGAPDLVLAGKAVRVRARAANQFALNDRGAMTRLRGFPRQEFAGLATSQNNHVEMFGCWHRDLLDPSTTEPHRLRFSRLQQLLLYRTCRVLPSKPTQVVD